MGVSIHGDTPKKAWFIKENPHLKWVFFGATPIFLESHGAIFWRLINASSCRSAPASRDGSIDSGGHNREEILKVDWIIWI